MRLGYGFILHLGLLRDAEWLLHNLLSLHLCPQQTALISLIIVAIASRVVPGEVLRRRRALIPVLAQTLSDR